MRYVVALVVAALLIGGVVLYIRQTDRVLEQAIRQALMKQQQAGTLPPELQGVDLQTVNLKEMGGFQMSLPVGLEQRLKLSLMLTDFWYVWGPLVVVICLGAASLVGFATKPEK
jgi:hypothetical protein